MKWTLEKWIESGEDFGQDRHHLLPSIFEQGEKLSRDEIEERLESYLVNDMPTFEDFRRGIFNDVWGRAAA
jgi:hypothetical protein